MPSSKPRITVYTNDDVIKKISFIAKTYDLSISSYVSLLLGRAIRDFEQEYGGIDVSIL